MQRCFFSLLLSVVNARRKKKKRKMERNTARSMIASSSHQLRRCRKVCLVSFVSRGCIIFKIVRKFPLKIHTKDTHKQQTNKKKSVIGNQRIHPLCHTALLTQRASRSLLKRERMTEAGIEPAISGLFLTKIVVCVKP